MEPENQPLQKEIPNLETHPFSGSMLNFGGVDTDPNYISLTFERKYVFLPRNPTPYPIPHHVYLFVFRLLMPRILADGWQHGLFQLHQRGAEVLERSFSCEYPGGTLNNQFLYGTPIHFCETFFW